MDFYDLIRQRPMQTHYAVTVNGDALKCPVELGHTSGRARLLPWANGSDWITFNPRLGYMRVVHCVLDCDGDMTVELEDSNAH